MNETNKSNIIRTQYQICRGFPWDLRCGQPVSDHGFQHPNIFARKWNLISYINILKIERRKIYELLHNYSEKKQMISTRTVIIHSRILGTSGSPETEPDKSHDNASRVVS